MPGISRDDVAHLARLARIAMTDVELDRLSGQIEVMDKTQQSSVTLTRRVGAA